MNVQAAPNMTIETKSPTTGRRAAGAGRAWPARLTGPCPCPPCRPPCALQARPSPRCGCGFLRRQKEVVRARWTRLQHPRSAPSSTGTPKCSLLPNNPSSDAPHMRMTSATGWMNSFPSPISPANRQGIIKCAYGQPANRQGINQVRVTVSQVEASSRHNDRPNTTLRTRVGCRRHYAHHGVHLPPSDDNVQTHLEVQGRGKGLVAEGRPAALGR